MYAFDYATGSNVHPRRPFHFGAISDSLGADNILILGYKVNDEYG